jgi:hypothetical protein
MRKGTYENEINNEVQEDDVEEWRWGGGIFARNAVSEFIHRNILQTRACQTKIKSMAKISKQLLCERVPGRNIQVTCASQNKLSSIFSYKLERCIHTKSSDAQIFFSVHPTSFFCAQPDTGAVLLPKSTCQT